MSLLSSIPLPSKKGSQIQGVGKAGVPDGKQTSVQAVTKQTTWVWAPKSVTKRQVRGKFVKLNQKNYCSGEEGDSCRQGSSDIERCLAQVFTGLLQQNSVGYSEGCEKSKPIYSPMAGDFAAILTKQLLKSVY
ncbi:hypothetical protein [Lentilactobacillus kisonensis]|uniref:hypothetical protein n=1 Tax=Lentilactobacillus kisonensis TaxID=481722 RepID=UPI001FB320E5|nr:hypothetical protein [Lentilactobacillus kisonensis]